MSKQDTQLELVFIESDVADLDVLLADIGPGKEVHVLDAGSNGLEQIAAILQGRGGIDALHLVSHGAQGAVHLGALTLTADNLPDHAADLATIGGALTANADILLYGCDVAAGSSGAALIDALARATQADIAASSDLTGAAAKGGDWELENSTGSIDSTPLSATHYDNVMLPNTAPIVVTDTNPPGTTITAAAGDLFGTTVLVQDSGKLIVVGNDNGGDLKLLRYNADGTLDTTFGSSGFISTNVSGFDQAYAATQQSDGKIVVTATVNSNTDWALVRYNADGTLDTGFGGGQGHIVTDLNASSQDQALSVTLQNDGKILVAGNSYSTTYGYQLAVARYNADGTLDGTFGSGGKFYYNANSAGRGGDEAYGITVQEDSEAPGNRKIVVVGKGEINSGTYDIVTLRLNDNGALDTSFNTDGVALTDIGSNDRGNAVAIQNDGKVLVTGQADSSDFLLRYNSDGTLDTAFGTSGIVKSDIGAGLDVGNAVRVTSDGKILVSGSTMNRVSDGDFAVWRYDANGTLDTTFGGDGLATHNFGMTYVADVANSLAVQSDGKLVVAGTTAGPSGLYRIGLVRFNNDGTLDSGFGNGAGLTYTVGETPVPLSAWVADAEMEDAASYAGMTLTLQRQGGANIHDVFGANNVFGESGGLKGSLSEGSGLTIDFGGFEYTFGTVTQNSGGTLVLTFADADDYGGLDRGTIGMILSQLTFSTTAASSPAQLEWSFNDNGGGSPQISTGITTVNVIAPDTTAPTFDVAPTTADITTQGFTPSASIDEAGTVYYVVLAGGDSAPSVAQVIDGQSSTGDMALGSGSALTVSAPFTPWFLPLSWLNTNTSYDIYFAAEDSLGNRQAVVTKVSMTTAAPPVAPDAPTLNAASDTGNSNTDGLTNDTTPTYTVSSVANGATVTLFNDADNDGIVDSGEALASGVASGTSIDLTASTLPAATYTNIKAIQSFGSDSSTASVAAGTLIIDTQAPTLAITSNVSALRIGDTATITFTFSEDPGSSFTWDGSSGDVVVSGGMLSAISGSGLTRTAVFTPTLATDAGTASITVAASAYIDAAGNNGGAGTTPSLSFDTKAPTLSITSDKSTLIAGDTATITFTFSEDPGASFSWDGKSGDLSGGTLGAISGTGTTRTAVFTPDADIEDSANISVAAGAYYDTAGNKGSAGATPSINIDTLTPTLTITSDKDALKIDDTATITFTFSEDPGATFAADDISVSGGTLGSLSGSGTTRTAVFTPTANMDSGKGSISVAAGLYTDTAGNGDETDATLAFSFDTKAPTLSITSDKSALKIGDTATITFTFSEDPGSSFTWDGSSGDIVVSGGMLSAISGTGTTRTATFTPSTNTDNGTASITVTANAYIDAAGNNGGAGTTPSLSFDTLAPDAPSTPVLDPSSDLGQSNSDALTNDITPTFTGTAELGSTVVLYDTDGTTVLGTATADNDKGFWSITSSKLDHGTHSVSAKTIDAVGNESKASATFDVNIDTAAPTLVISTSKSTLKAGETATITFTFSEDPGTTFSDEDWVFNRGTLGVITGTGTTRTATFTPTAGITGKASISVADDLYTDAAGNSGFGGIMPSIDVDTRMPTLTITSDKETLKADDTATLTFTFSEDPGETFDATDISVSGGTLGALSGTGTIRSAVFTPAVNKSEAVTINVEAGTYTNGIGNNGAAAELELKVNTLRPSATIVVADAALSIDETSLVTFTFSEAVSGFTKDDLKVSNGTVGAITSADGGITWTTTFTPNTKISDTTNLITLDNTGVANAVNNAGVGTTDSNNYAIDTLRPTATIVVKEATLGADETSQVTLTFSEAVTGLTSDDLTFSNGTVGMLTSVDGGFTWTTIFTPNTKVSDTTNLITLDNTGVMDAAGNTGSGTTDSNTFAIDTLAPDAPSAPDLIDDSDLGFASTDNLTSDTTPTFTGTADASTVNVTLYEGSTKLGSATPDKDGVWSITSATLGAGTHTITAKALDAFNNESAVSLSLEVDIDDSAPTLAITSDKSALKAGETATLTFTFSEDPGSSFTWNGKSGDVSFSNGTLGALSGTGTTRTATFTPAADFDGSASVSVSAASWTDAAGNAGGSAEAGTIDIDTQAPSLTITSDKSTLKSGDTATLTFTFSEDPGASFDDSDIEVSGGTLSTLSGTGTTRTATFTPTANTEGGNASIVVEASSYTDAVGNAGTGGQLKGLAYDTVSPTVSGVSTTTADGSYGIGSTIDIELTFSETVNVTGTPQLLLETGAIDRAVNYAGGSGTNTLTFTYTVQAGDASSDLDYTGINAVALNGGTILDADGNAALLTLAAPGEEASLGADAALVIDTAAPEFASASIDGDSLVLSYTDADLLDAAHPPLSDSFTVMSGTTALTVTAVAVDAAGKTLTLTLDNAVTAGEVVTLSYADPTGGNDAQAIQDKAGNDAAALVAVSVTNGTAPEDGGNGTPPGGVTETVDGVDVITSTTTEDGVEQTVVTIAPIAPTRTEDQNTPNSALADIPLVQSVNGIVLLQIGLPISYGLIAAGPLQPPSDWLTLRANLIAATLLRLADDDFAQVLQDGIDRYVPQVEDPSLVPVRTLTLTQDGSAPLQPVAINGVPSTSDQAPPALVIDTRSLSAVPLIQLDNVEFAAVVGSAILTGGAGSNFVFGDSASQTIFLGADDDELHGGGGDDVVASNGGNDHLFGDAGNDRVVGGVGDDVLEGGAGDDLLQGGASSAGNWNFGIGADGQLLAHFTPRDALLAAPGDQHGSLWAYDPVIDVLADSRVAFMQAPVAHLAIVSALFKAVMQNLPTVAELNQLATLGQDLHQLAERAYAAYAQLHPAPAEVTDEVRALITHVLGAEAATPDLVQLGTEFFQSGGSRADALLYLVNDARFQAGMKDMDGTFHLAQDLEVSELDWDASSGNDVLRGGDGNDTLAGGSGDDLLDGGAGNDIAVLKLSAAYFTLSLDADANVVLHNQTMGETDTLVSVEFLQFGDQLFALEVPSQVVGPQQALEDFLRPATEDEIMLVGMQHEA